MSGRKVVTPSFEILRKGGVLKVVPIRTRKMLVGSDASVDLRLKHPRIAARHLEIEVVEGRYLQATNLAGDGQVTLDGSPIEVCRLQEGDTLDLGPVQIRLAYQRSDKASPVPQAQRAVPEPVADEAPTDADFPAPFRSPEPDEDDGPLNAGGQLSEETTLTMRSQPRSRSEDAPTQAMDSIRRPAPSAPRPPSPTPKGPNTIRAPSASLGPERTWSGFVPAVSSPLETEPDLLKLTLDPMPVLSLAPGPGLQRTLPVPVGTFEIGSGPCAIRLPGGGVAGRHAALIVMPDGAVYLRHMAGEAGVTTLNGRPLTYARIRPGDAVSLGEVKLELWMVPLAELPGAPSTPPTQHPRPSMPKLETVPARTTDEDDSGAGIAPPFGAPYPYQRGPELVQAVPELPPDEAFDSPISADPLSALTPSHQSTAAPEAASAETPQAQPPSLVRRKLDPKVKQPARPGARPLPADFTEEIEIDYRKPLWQRAMVPAVIVLLLGVIAFQFWAYRQERDTPVSTGPRKASGQAPDVGSLEVDTAGGGTMVVGSPRRSRVRSNGGGQPVEYLGAGSSGGYGNATTTIDPANDWDPDVASRTVVTHGDVGGADRATADSINSSAEAEALELAEYKAEEAAERKVREEAAELKGAPAPGQGYVEMKDVESVIYRDQKKLRYCYGSARESNPGLAGVMWLKVTLGPDGRIREASLEARSTLQDQELFNCLRRQLSTMAMPKPDGGSVSFSYPFELTQ